MPAPTILDPSQHFFNVSYEGNGGGQRIGKFVPYTDNGTIAKSCIFDSASNVSLTRTPSSAGNRRTWTWSGWVKRGDMSTYGAGRILLQHGNASGLQEVIRIDSAATNQYLMYYSDADTGYVKTNATVNDPSAWFNFIFVLDTFS